MFVMCKKKTQAIKQKRRTKMISTKQIYIQFIGNFHHNKPSCVYTSISKCRPIVRLECSQEHLAGSLVIRKVCRCSVTILITDEEFLISMITV